MAKWRKDAKPNEVCDRFEKSKIGGKNGQANFTGFDFSEHALILGGMVELAMEIPGLEKRKIINKAIFDAGGKGVITPASLLVSCSRHEAAYLRQPKVLFRLFTAISVWTGFELPVVRLGGLTITFNPKANRGLKARLDVFDEVQYSLGFQLPSDYTNVSVAVHARSPHEGAQRALDCIDLLRATWNLSINTGKGWRHSSGVPKPVNDILMSPFHTMHQGDGHLATDSWWYDPGYKGPATVFSDRKGMDALLKFSQRLRAKLLRSAYRTDIENALVRYVRALDSTDLHDTFLRLWGLLEYLTDSSQDPYKVAIRRAAFICTNPDYSLQVLTHLMLHRNTFVHAGKDTDEIESLVYMLKRYVDALLLFHIRDTFKFASRSAAANFLDQPNSRKEIEFRISALRQAHKFVTTP